MYMDIYIYIYVYIYGRSPPCDLPSALPLAHPSCRLCGSLCQHPPPFGWGEELVKPLCLWVLSIGLRAHVALLLSVGLRHSVRRAEWCRSFLLRLRHCLRTAAACPPGLGAPSLQHFVHLPLWRHSPSWRRALRLLLRSLRLHLLHLPNRLRQRPSR